MRTSMLGLGLVVRAGMGATALLAASAGATAQQGNAYRATALVSDGSIPAPNTDGNLVNGWGVAFNPTGFVWVADNETGVASLYDGTGAVQQLVVNIPSDVQGTNGHPTGIVFSGGNDFSVTNGRATAPARFIFATENGVISGWAPQVDLHNAIASAGDTEHGAIYKGLALGTGRIFASDFHNAKVDVFDGGFAPMHLGAGAFTDPHLPARFAPFGIQAIENRIVVTFAMQDENAEDEVAGPGLGAVDIFDQDGHLLARVAAGGRLNAPWGVARAPANFGAHSNELLIGNFGDGRINGFAARGHGFVGTGPLRGERGQPITVEGLWGIAFGNGVSNQPTNTLFFAAGPADESEGLYGRIDPPAQHGHGQGEH